LAFPSGRTFVGQSKCGKPELEAIHRDILQDIQTIQIGTGDQCKSRANWYNYGKCLSSPTQELGQPEDPLHFFKSFIGLYGSNTLGIQVENKLLDASDANVTVSNPTPATRAYVLLLDDLVTMGQQLNITFQTYNVVEKPPGFQLAAIISTSGGHFVAIVKDFVSGTWTRFNNLNKTEVARQFSVLPPGIHDWATGFQDTDARYRPSSYIYFRNEEIDAIIKRVQNVNKQAPPPPPPKSSPAWNTQNALAESIFANPSIDTDEIKAFVQSLSAPADANLAQSAGLVNARGERVTRWSIDPNEGGLVGTLVIDQELWMSPPRKAAFLYLQQMVTQQPKTPQVEENIRQAMVAAHFVQQRFEKNDLDLTEYPTDQARRDIVEEYERFAQTPEAKSNKAYKDERIRITKLRLRK
jgi:hypothetical protein